MSESSEQAAWEKQFTRRDVLLKGAAAGGALAASGVLARAASARPTAAWLAASRAATATLFVANHGDMQNLDPYTSSADTVTGDILTNLYSIPVTFKLDGTHGGARFAQSTQFRGQVASAWKLSKDKKQVVFTIRNGTEAQYGVSFVLETSDPDVACITERRVATSDLGAGQQIIVGSLDPAQPGDGVVDRADRNGFASREGRAEHLPVNVSKRDGDGVQLLDETILRLRRVGDVEDEIGDERFLER